ncbi:Carboxylic ester hydrolase [Camponotus japonicus]
MISAKESTLLNTMLIRLLIVLLCLNLAILANSDETAPRVKTLSGALKGYYKISQYGRKYEAYEGIPYALPPVGELRFKPPQPILPWIGELPATNFGSPCIQYAEFPIDPTDRVEGAEDCLYLNIYVPELNVTENKILLPVLFWLHGGAFQYDSGKNYGAKYLMDRDVILVTIDYRLGPMGFLSTEDEVVPGNMGLKDQNMALRWVSQNIESFGGDPNGITLIGHSAGGASVQYHYLSPLSVGLFRGGMSYSGTAFDGWTHAKNSLEKTQKLSALMGCPTTTSKDMIDCLRYRPARDIVQATSAFMYFLYNPFTPFGPVVEKGSDAPFIDKTPAEIVNNGDVQDLPWVTSVVSQDGLFPVAEFIANNEALKQLNDNWDVLGPRFLDFYYTIPEKDHVEIARLIKQHYFDTKPIDHTTTKQLVQMASDRFFYVDSEKAALMQAKVNQNPVWYSYFSYRGNQSLSEYMSGTTNNYGVCHGDDIAYILNTPWMDPTTTQRDRDMQKVLIDNCVSFATNGITNVYGVNWLKLNPSEKEFHYLHIASPTEKYTGSSANFGDEKFWNSIKFNETVLTT